MNNKDIPVCWVSGTSILFPEVNSGGRLLASVTYIVSVAVEDILNCDESVTL
jgi:hypothetical protein